MSFTTELSSNPFEVLEQRLIQSIDQLLDRKIKALTVVPDKSDDELVEFKEACTILHLSEDRLYAIHPKYFNTKKPGKHLLFLRKELNAYLDGKIKPKKAA